jgi:nucleoside phosphorylase
VVVSRPSRNSSGVVQYDYGRTLRGGYFEQTGSLNKPPQILLNAISRLITDYELGAMRTSQIFSDTIDKYPNMTPYFTSPGPKEDRLFNAIYDHIGHEETCILCDPNQLVNRESRPSNRPKIHYGVIASANQVMKHGQTRDRLTRDLGILCFEMEAAGLMDQVPCLVVRGICDYADSHKTKQWQKYAAGTAAVYTKELLSSVPVQTTEKTNSAYNAIYVLFYQNDFRDHC